MAGKAARVLPAPRRERIAALQGLPVVPGRRVGRALLAMVLAEAKALAPVLKREMQAPKEQMVQQAVMAPKVLQADQLPPPWVARGGKVAQPGKVAQAGKVGRVVKGERERLERMAKTAQMARLDRMALTDVTPRPGMATIPEPRAGMAGSVARQPRL